MAVLAKVSTLRKQLPSILVDLSLCYCCTAHGCSSFFVYRGLCKNRSIDVRGRMQCLHVNLYGPQLLYSACNIEHVFLMRTVCTYRIYPSQMGNATLYIPWERPMLEWSRETSESKAFEVEKKNRPFPKVILRTHI